MYDFLHILTIRSVWDLIFYHTATPSDSPPVDPQCRGALVHKYAQSIEFITFFDLTQKNVTY